MPGGGERLTEVLRVLSACGHDLDADQVLDVLWIADRLPSGARSPLHRDPRTAPAPHDPASAAAPGPAAPPGPAPEPGDADLPDLTAPSLYAAARRTPAEPAPAAAVPGEEPRRAMPVRVPEEKALAAQLELGRALRPLRRRLESRRRTRVDEERTAEALAETGLADVVERPVRERWLNLVLLVDDGLSMLLWHRLGVELRALLERLGAFALTRVIGLDTRGRTPALHARPFSADGAELQLSSVNDPSGRTLVLVVSDGMGAAWRAGAMHDLLAGQAAHGPVAVLHTLRYDMWESSGIAADRWQVTTRRIGGANTSWEITDPVLPQGLAAFDGIPVPVLEPTPAALGAWARLLASPGTTAELPLLTRPSRFGAVAAARDLGSAQHFRDAATPEAYRLAAHLAAVSPLSVPVMRLVQSAVPWPASTSHLAEVFLGGLVRPAPAPVAGPLPAKHRVFDFTEPAKTVLLDAVPQTELLRTSRRIGLRLEQLAGNSPDFPAWLAHPDGAADLPASHHPFTSVERRLLSRFGVSVGGPRPGPGPGPAPAADTDDWGPLAADDPREIGGFTLRGRRRGRRTLVYRGEARGTQAVIRVPRPDLPTVNARLIEVETEALARLRGHYAPSVIATGLGESPPWLAMTPIADPGTPDTQPLRLEEIFTRATAGGNVPFDLLRGLLVSWYLAGAVAACHTNGLVPADLGADSVFVLRRTVMLGNLSDCVVDGEYLGSGPVPTREDNIRSLGELMQMISSKPGMSLRGLPESMHLWHGGSWDSLRKLVERCLDPDPARRPPAAEVVDMLARYVAQARMQRGDAEQAPLPASRPAPVPLTPPAAVAPPAGHGVRVPRFGAARRETEARLERLRRPLAYSRRVTLVGAYHYSGRATTTVALGGLLAATRGEPVLAVDGAPSEGSLHAFLPAAPGQPGGRRLRELAGLAPSASYEEISARTARLPSGLEVVSHGDGFIAPNAAHAHEYAHLLELTARHYPFVLTDWSPVGLGPEADVVLDRTDRLVLVCGTADWFLDAAARSLDALRERGYETLARQAVVAAVQIDQPASRGVPVSVAVAGRLAVDRSRVVHVPHDPALRSPRWALGKLRGTTTDAFLELAELVSPREDR
ncbi:hypothetical protein SRB5_07240 [Streptomyces sp. RB5]|uniref:Protein kinase domain-containing protein n=1 Tax=Streptomyces smaragdinus TaxID=2585196 RepID=A0A7K0CB64_9ACTN|nr:SAV_2336 N-terminal domain-related protein [Streptomyces smaragdinus]MQY10613.1 hypothetical protein [Streptomyces smaragdinus]